jgi:replicative DNA helicase
MAPPTPPHSVEAEESVIGGVLVHPRRLLDVIPLLKPDDFYQPALRAIYEAMLELDGASKPVDALTVVEQMRALETFDKLRAFGGTDYFTDLMAKVVTVENIAYHARIVRSKAKRRRMAESLRALTAAAFGDNDADEDFFAEFQRQALALAIDGQDEENRPVNFTPVMTDYHKNLEERYKMLEETGEGAITGVPTGFGDLDRLLCGLQPTDLIIAAGRPSMGKTSFAMNIGAFVAMSEIPVLVFSLEMGRRQLAERTLSGEARVDSQRMRHAQLETKHWLRLSAAMNRLAGKPLEILDRGTITIAEIRSIARVWRMAHRVQANGERPFALVIVDYLQLIEGGGGRGGKGRARQNENRQQDVSDISRGLKQLAKDLACPVMALSQLNRSLESRADKRPMMSDLRESGAIEQDADVIAFIYRDEVYSKDQCRPEDKGVAEVIVAKQRMGPTGMVKLAFQGAFTKFDNLTSRREQP